MYKSYKNKENFSYTLGAYPTFELLNSDKYNIIEVIADEDFSKIDEVRKICAKKNIKFSVDKKTLNRISKKDNTYLAGVFEKKKDFLQENKNHIVLVFPMDMGNLGTIIRSMHAFSFKNLAICENSCDIFNPKVIRASMGSFFKINIEIFESFNDYLKKYGKNRKLFSFMLTKNAKELEQIDISKKDNFSLIFGSEGPGLNPSFEQFSTPVIIPQEEDIDSLNLSIAASVGIFYFRKFNI